MKPPVRRIYAGFSLVGRHGCRILLHINHKIGVVAIIKFLPIVRTGFQISVELSRDLLLRSVYFRAR